MNSSEIIAHFDAYLAERDLSLDAVIIGGAALALLGVVSRQTRDCDILHPELPESILAAARAFAAEVRQTGEFLQDDWLNNGPAALIGVLPGGWQERLQLAFAGRAITFRCLGRADLLRSKLFALCDRGIDLGDCLALRPTATELRELSPWIELQDGNPGWPSHVLATLTDLARRLGHGV